MIGIKLPKNKEISINKVNEYLEPKYVYFEINDNELLVKENDKIIEGAKIIKNNKFNTYIHSSVSGTVKEIVEKYNSIGIKSKFIKIENDFTKKIYKKNKPDKITKKEFINILKENGIVGLGGAGFPTYLKYDSNFETLIINGVECEPYITSDYTIMVTKIKEIFKTINKIDEIFNLKDIYIAIKKNQKLIDNITPYLTDKIKLIIVPNLYPMGWEKSLVRYIKHVDYEKIPIERGIVVSNISTIYSIYESLFYNKPLIEKIVTVTGNAIKKPTNIKLKIGTPFNDLLDIVGNYNEKEVTIVAGGPMMGKNIESDEFIISNNLNSILILNDIKNIKELTCLRCGKCSDNCPVKISPVLVKDNINNKEELTRLNVNKCIECGICSYICPSKINLREFLIKAKKKVK